MAQTIDPSGTDRFILIKDDRDGIRTIAGTITGRLVDDPIGGGGGSGNATVPNDAPIQPPQAFVDAAVAAYPFHSPQVAANATARKALTGLVLGEHVKESDTGLTYEVVDAGNLSSDAGWEAIPSIGRFTVDGVLSIAGPDVVVLDATLTGEMDFVAPLDIESISFPRLSVLGANGFLNFDGVANLQSVAFPILANLSGSHSQISLYELDSLTEISLPVLADLSGDHAKIYVSEVDALTERSYPALTDISGGTAVVEYYLNAALDSIDFPVLADVSGTNAALSIHENLVTNLSLPLLADISGDGAGLFVNAELALASLNLPSLADISGEGATIYVADSTALTNLSLPSLVEFTGSSASIYVANCALTESAVDTLLQKVAEGVTASNNTSGITLDLSGGTNAAPGDGAVDDNAWSIVAHNGIVKFNLHDVQVVLDAPGASCNFSGNALTGGEVNALLAYLVANFLNAAYTLDISGGTNAAPSGQGATDKTALEGGGWTVTTN